MAFSLKDFITDQIRKVFKDGIDYLASVLALLQARMTAYALSAVLFIVLIGFASLLFLVAFTVLNIALGFWLKEITNSVFQTLLLLGAFYGILGALIGGVAVRWLHKLKS